MVTTFKQLSQLDNNTVMVVDALNLAFRWKHSGAKQFSDEYIRTIDSLRKSYKAGKVIIACDEGSSSYRKEIFPDYKQNRVDRYKDQTEQERLDFEAFFKEFNTTIDIIKNLSEVPFPILRYNKVEADDIAAYVVRKLKKTHNIWLMSSDKDWDLLVDDTVSRFSYVTRKEITKDNWNDHYEYAPDEHISIKCLTGDSGDNIPGVDGIGPKRAITLVQEYGSCFDIIASLPISSRYKYIASLNNFGADNLLRNYRLMDLVTYCEEALGEQNCKEIDTVLERYINEC
jgi:5'-3' exonuclease